MTARSKHCDIATQGSAVLQVRRSMSVNLYMRLLL